MQERGHVSHIDLMRAIQQQLGQTILLGELLLENGLVTKSDLGAALELITRVPYQVLSSAAVDSQALSLLPRSVAERCCALPLRVEDRKLLVAMAEPQNMYTLNELRFVSGLEIAPRLAFRAELLAAIKDNYELQDGGELSPAEGGKIQEKNDLPSIEFFSVSSRRSQMEAIKEFQAELRQVPTPAVRLVSAMIAEAASKRASDIHVDPQATATAVRMRVDGILRDLMEIPRDLQDSVISRIKILADMDIAERRAPQDGRLLVRIGAIHHDLRVSTLPTSYGEKVVIRLLNASAALVGFEELGLAPELAESLSRILALPQGMLLVTGPTGSGKTTTLYAAINRLRSRTLNIITVENPVEYMLEGINQVQVNEKAGRTFANCLRSILRQDPNVILVGEIRDAETAEIALTAAQTGHMVLSTLHTSDSISAITRLVDLNIPPFLIASTVTAVLAQRLVRRLCTCSEEMPISPESESCLLAAGITDFERKSFVPVGCPACDQTGYLGRIGIYEMLPFHDLLSEAIRTGAGPAELREIAANHGTRFLQEDVLFKVRMGFTSVEEMLRVIPLKSPSTCICSGCARRMAPSFLFCPHCGSKTRGNSSAHEARERDAMRTREPAQLCEDRGSF